MRILVVGSGGREHALCWAIAASPLCTKLFCAPGNAGIAGIAECVEVGAEDIAGQLALVQREKIDFVVVGPEGPLVAGLADRLAGAGIKVFGPSAKAARLEGSKGFTKDLCRRHGIPTAAYERFTDAAKAQAYIEAQGAPIVVKADGLAAGKGVVVAETVQQAIDAVRDMLSGNRFGAAGASVVVEEFMEGEEASLFALCDGEHALALAGAQDHKRAFDGDKGPNTGGMGAYSPAPVLDAAMVERAMREIVLPTVRGLAADGAPYKGVLYAGLMIGPEGPRLVEYNCRFGDPECQVLMMRLKSDIVPALLACAEGGLGHFDLRWANDAALTVVMAAKGYPDAYEKGSEIRNLDAAGEVEGVQIFHAGTRFGPDGKRVLANGGRVLNVTAMAPTVEDARSRAYRAVDLIDWPQGFCRRDIAWRAVTRRS
ncbi:phosphoribosylamine--glycine ligase [Enhydrobacter sp.]|jgi:phosphoribosylamine--glycine ligase|uniref:phosphoribosylamine--glycine ligase n=1 Tax=Enhydrobacter sp. TaxID=1894999 RepID=UPI0026070C9D|nr:phosphoribosylamine--glycine ligase [Enhydrobacter sp.]WIM12298.1 MAG: Phosphoribosylamine--glycine ligase [Enhydrobacter sp.]